jgi:hypothetical protein
MTNFKDVNHKRNYIGWFLNDAQKHKLLNIFKPKFKKVYADHVTYKFGTGNESLLPNLKSFEIIGYVHADGIEALVVSINGSYKRPDGKVYHITWSLDPSKYKPVDSNDLIEKKHWENFEHPIKLL